MLKKLSKKLRFWLVISITALFSISCLNACGKAEKKEPQKQATEQPADQKSEKPKKAEGIPLPKDF